MKRSTIMLVLFLTFIFASSTIVGSFTISPSLEKNNNLDKSIIVGPYPQNPDIDAITICWETSEKTRFNKVCYGLTPDCENVVFEKNLIRKYFHKVKINNLAPSTKYFYKVYKCACTAFSDVYLQDFVS